MERQLRPLLAGISINDLENIAKIDGVAMKLAVLSTELDYRVAHDGIKFPQLVGSYGKEVVLAQVCIIIKAFSETIRSKDKLRNSEIVETAALILSEYTAESIEDILMAFKRAKLRGDVFYYGLEQGKIFEIINTYLGEKAEWRESFELRKKKEFEKVARFDKSDGLTEAEFKANMARLQAEIDIANGKVKPVSTGETYFNEKIKKAIKLMSVDELRENRKGYENQSLYNPDRFKEQIGWIDAEIKERLA